MSVSELIEVLKTLDQKINLDTKTKDIVPVSGSVSWREYHNTEELIADYKQRFCVGEKNVPVIWVKNRQGVLSQILQFTGYSVSLIDEDFNEIKMISMQTLFNCYRFNDHSICGVAVQGV